MKELIIQYARYNAWANKKLFERISKLSHEQIHEEVKSSFPDIFKTVHHMLLADSIWWQRLMLVENVDTDLPDFNGDFNALSAASQKQSTQWEEWISKASENQLNHVFWYKNSKKEQFRSPVCQMLMHLFNHATFHRGQLVTILRELGVTDIPQTDFILYCRAKK